MWIKRLRHGGQRFALLLPVAFVISGGLVFQASNAAFTATATNPGNTWSSGTVVLTTVAPFGSAVFSPTNLKPGDTATKCVTVTYSGSLTAAAVKLYVTSQTGTLGTYLTMTVTQGTGATDIACTGFTADVSGSGLYSGTLAAMGSSYGTGVGSWTPSGGSTTTKSYQITYLVQDNNLAQGLSAGATFTWEAQNA